jgi:hypothetical protein
VKVDWKCEVCGSKSVTWTDYHGEAVCMTCGTPYQILQYDENNKPIKDAVPRMNIKAEYVPLLRQYWNEAHRYMGLGSYMGQCPCPDDRKAFHEWLAQQPEPKQPQP